MNTNQAAIAVFTGKSVDHILMDGGSQSWVLDRNNALRCAYLVCCRSGVHWVEGREPQGSAFLVGRIDDVVASTEDANRWLIRCSEYALISVLNVWQSWRNPVRYSTLSDLGISIKSLDFRPMPDVSVPPAGLPESKTIKPVAVGLTIAEAKRGLAITFGVAEDAVAITIRG